MANYTQHIIAGHLNTCTNGGTNQIKGKALEDLACYLFETIPGVSISLRNAMNVFMNEEIDVAIWNDKSRHGLVFLPNVVLIECKNWSNSVSSHEVSWFCQKLQTRGLDFGILIANNGISGDAVELMHAHNTLAFHLSQKRSVIVITRAEIAALQTTAELIKLIKTKICLLAVSGRIS